ncbi:hypothetical protein TL16_g11627 [Triparma laevis f. inornata]|uniref:RING-type domain-containing protein n=1 Tax=Triparma laevis f. inornata TaxID=1714386 RepID=A0A9W7ETD6_9STRA|nr:hypothetical protein TL16_g11627 [Triparma laevis f. inornata]
MLVTNYPNAYQNSTFQSQPASFGYYYYQSKVYTRLLIYDPTNKNLCNPPDPDHISLKLDPNESYMLLAQRGDCFFNEKAGIAQQYSNLCGGCVQGVVVYDNMQTDQITQMSKNPDDPDYPDIGLMGVTLNTGNILTSLLKQSPSNIELIQFDGVGYSPFPMDPGDWMLIVIAGAVMVVGSMCCLYLCVRTGVVRRRENDVERYEDDKHLMDDVEVEKLEEILYEHAKDLTKEEKEERTSYFENDSCPVCLEDYVPDESLKLLPCKHAFHEDCIKPWLTQQQGSCPLCKEIVCKQRKKSSDAIRAGRRISRSIMSDIIRTTTGEGEGVVEEETAAQNTEPNMETPLLSGSRENEENSNISNV